MQANQTTSPPSYRIVRGALTLFNTPQAALSYACDLAALSKRSVVVVFDKRPLGAGSLMPTMGPGSARLQ